MSLLGDLFDEGVEEGGSNKDTSSFEKSKLPPPSRSHSGLCGIYNQGATCYLNSLIQTLVMTPEFREGLFKLDPKELGDLIDKDKPGSRVRVIPIQLQRLFARILLLDAQGAKTAELTDSFGWTSNEEFIQQDVQELNRILFSAIEDSLVGTSGQSLIKELYHGTIVNQIICQECGKVSEREEDFLDLCISVAGCHCLEEGIRKCFVETELLEGKNKYMCEGCAKLVNAKKGAKLRHLPPVLTVSLLRFSFDFVKMERFKETGKFTFPQELDMSAYCENESQAGAMEYELYSVVIHQGSSHGGHYHAYIRDIDALGRWTNPNDEKIMQPADPTTGNVEFLNFDSPLELIEALLLRNPKDGIGMDKLCAEIVKHTGVSWNKRFKRNYGPINKFLQSADLFTFYPDANWVELKNWRETSTPASPQTSKPSTKPVTKEVARPKQNDRVPSPPPAEGYAWFDFDDSRIHPISTKDIEKQFSGKASAYMLFYRQKCLTRPADAIGNSLYGVPEGLVEEVLIENSLLDLERCEYEKKQNTIMVQVHYHLFYEYHRGALRPIDSEMGPPEYPLHIDVRKPVSFLKEEVKRIGGNFVTDNFEVHIRKELPAGFHLQECITDDESKAIRDTAVGNNSVLFVWNGKTISDVIYRAGPENEPILVHLVYGPHSKTSNGYCKSYTGKDLRFSVAEVTGIDALSLLLKRVVEGPDGKKMLKTILYEDDKKTLAEIGIQDNDEITVEDIYGTESNFDAVRYLNQVNEPKKAGQICVKVENKCFGKIDRGIVVYETVDVEIEKESTVETLKAIVLSLTDVENVAACRLRVDNDDRGLMPPLHEDQSVADAGLRTGVRLVMEPGDPPTTNQLTLTFTPGDSKGDKPYLEVLLEKNSSVRQCLKSMCDKAELEDYEDWHLRQTNWYGEPGPILDDLDLTLEQSELRDGGHLLLEYGRLPPKGFVKLPIWWFPTPSLLISEEGQNTVSWITDKLDCASVGPDERSHIPFDGEPALVGEVLISKQASLEQLKQQIMTLPALGENGISVPGTQFLRVSLLEDKRLGTVFRGSLNSLQRLKITSNSMVGIQVLPFEEDLNASQILLRVMTRIAGTRKYSKLVEMVWDTSRGVSPRCLRQTLADMCAINIERIAIAKHIRDKFEWLVISDQQPQQQQKQKGKKKARCNIKNAPYFIKDSDIIAIKNLEDDPMDQDDFSTIEDDRGKETLKMEAEDKKKRRDEMRRNAVVLDAGGAGDMGGKGKRKEVGIKIHVGDFR